MTNFFREIAELYRFLFSTPQADKDLIFYAEHEGYYSYYEGLIDELTGTRGRTLCYVTSDATDPIRSTGNPNIKPFYIEKFLIPFMMLVRCKVFVMTLTDLEQFHLKRSTHPVHYVYVFHSLVSTHMMYRHGAFDHYDSILCAGPHHTREIAASEEIESLKKKQLVEAGYFRLERIHRAHTAIESTDGERRVALVAPSWGPANVLETCGEELVRGLLESDWDVIVRPHPETIRRAPDLIAALDAAFATNPRFTLERSVSTDDSLLRADILVCDCSGIALEYALGCERPVLFVDVPVKVQNDRYKELDIEPVELALRSVIGELVPADDIAAIIEGAARLAEQGDAYREKLAALRSDYVYHFGRSSEVGAQHIEDILLANPAAPSDNG